MSQDTGIREALIGFISTELVGDGMRPIEADTDLLGSGIVDSLGMMSLVFFLEQEFDVEIPPEDVIIDHFGSVGAIQAYLSKRMS